jgi:hypothetical protein
VKDLKNQCADPTLPLLLHSLKLPTFVREYDSVANRAAAEGLSHSQYLLALAEMETAERSGRRIARLLEESKLPHEKTLSSYQLERLPAKARPICWPAWGMSWCDKTVRCSSPPPSRSCSACWPPSAS